MKDYFMSLFASPQMAVAQVIGFIAMTCAIICFQQKDRTRILIWQTIVCALWTTHFIVLGVAAGAAFNGMQVIRTLIFMRKGRDKWADWFGWLFIFIGLAIVIGVLAWDNIWSILPIAGTIFSTISLWMKKPFTIRLLTFPVAITWCVYDAVNMSVAGALNEVFCMVNLIIAIFRIDIPKIKRDKAEAGNASAY